jgi:hypothetical protein
LLGGPTGTVLKVSSRHFPSLACMARWRRACGFRKRRHAADLGFRCPCRALSAGAPSSTTPRTARPRSRPWADQTSTGPRWLAQRARTRSPKTADQRQWPSSGTPRARSASSHSTWPPPLSFLYLDCASVDRLPARADEIRGHDTAIRHALPSAATDAPTPSAQVVLPWNRRLCAGQAIILNGLNCATLGDIQAKNILPVRVRDRNVFSQRKTPLGLVFRFPCAGGAAESGTGRGPPVIPCSSRRRYSHRAAWTSPVPSTTRLVLGASPRSRPSR